MLPSLDTYVYTQIKSTLDVILKKPSIVDIALQGLDTAAKENFKATYCGVDAQREINVTYVFPQDHEGFDALYFVQLGPSKPTTDSIGSAEGTYKTRTGNTHREPSEVARDYETSCLYIPVTKSIADVDGIDGLEFAQSDQVKINGSRIEFQLNGNEHLQGLKVVVNYTERLSEEEGVVGIQKGFTSEDSVIVTSLSTNMDTARCLDALLKVILIIMRQSQEEQTGFALQKAYFEDMQALETGVDRIAFGRPLTLSYTLSYSIDFDLSLLTEIRIAQKSYSGTND